MYSKSTSWESTLSIVALKKELWLNEGVTMENSIYFLFEAQTVL
jgi:hypothetical protein